MIPQDYHIHTNFSCDSEASMVEMCRAAISLGIPEIGFTEHFDPIPLDPCRDYFRPEAWWEELSRCQSLFQGHLDIRAGIELGQPHRNLEEASHIIDAYPWDYTLCSLHWIGDALVFDHAYFQRPKAEAYLGYFHETLEMIQGFEFDILGHMDVVKRYGFEHYGPYDPREFEGAIRAVLRACAQRGIAIEVNTAPLRRSIGEISPSEIVLEWFRLEGGRWVTVGSDAHKTDQVGFGLDKALRSVLAAGFDHLASYTSHKPIAIQVPLPRDNSG